MGGSATSARESAGRRLHKSTIVIWSEFDPGTMELSALAREAEDGAAFCSAYRPQAVERPAEDADWDPGMAEFFWPGGEG